MREYIWLGDAPVAVIDGADTSSPSLRFVHVDHLNRPVMMTDSARTIVWRAKYKPFGEVFSVTGPASLDLRFPGQWFQLESGLHYNWHRTYDPTLGRYLQPDPLGLLGTLQDADSDACRPPFRDEAGHPVADFGAAVFRGSAPKGIPILDRRRGEQDAGQERADHAPTTTDVAPCPGRGERA